MLGRITMERKKTVLATLAALGGNAIFGFSFMFSRIALGAADPFVMLMYRFLLAFLAVEAIALFSRRKKLDGWLRIYFLGENRQLMEGYTSADYIRIAE